MSTMLKVEFEGEDADTYRDSRIQVGHAHLQEDSDADVGFKVKKENVLVLKMRHGADELAIKQELDVGPTLLRAQTQPLPLPPLVLFSSHISPVVQHLRTDSADSAAPAPPCLVYVQPAHVPRTERKDEHRGGDTAVPSHSDFLLGVRADNACQSVLREQTQDCSNSEGTSLGRQKRVQCRNYIRASTESDCAIDSINTVPGMHNTVRELSLLKYTNITRTPTGPNSYKQGVCGTSQVGSLKILTHRDGNPNCEYSSSHPSRLEIHTRTPTGEKPYKCEQCEYSAYRKYSLKVHMRTHMRGMPYKCEHCEYRAYRLNSLEIHMRKSHSQIQVRTHAGKKPYKCDYCDYSASRPCDLKVHIRIHTDRKHYKCGQCEYGTSRRDSLMLHMRTHTGEKPHKCKHCVYSAYQASQLKIHMRTHTGEKPYKCYQCDYSASRLSSMKRHILIHTIR